MAFTRRFEPAAAYASLALGLPDHPAFALLPRLIDHVRAVALSASPRIVSVADRGGALSLLNGAEADITIGLRSGQAEVDMGACHRLARGEVGSAGRTESVSGSRAGATISVDVRACWSRGEQCAISLVCGSLVRGEIDG